MMTVPEAARRAGRNPETIRRWIREGKLPARKVGTQHVLEEADLETYLDGASDRLPIPPEWKRTFWGAPMPDVVASHEAVVRATRSGEMAARYLADVAGTPPVRLDPWLTTIVGRIVRLCDPVRIVLFGSRARGDAREDSDYDLLVVLDEVTDRRAMRLEVRRVLDDLPISKDVIVAPVEDIEREGLPWGALGWALREGRTLYERQ